MSSSSRPVRSFRPAVDPLDVRVVPSVMGPQLVAAPGEQVRDAAVGNASDPEFSGGGVVSGGAPIDFENAPAQDTDYVAGYSSSSSSSYSDLTTVTLGVYDPVAVEDGWIYEGGDPLPQFGQGGDEWYVEYTGPDPTSSSSSSSGYSPSGNSSYAGSGIDGGFTAPESWAPSGIAYAQSSQDETPAQQLNREISEHNAAISEYRAARATLNQKKIDYELKRSDFLFKKAEYERRYSFNLGFKSTMTFDITTRTYQHQAVFEFNPRLFERLSQAAKTEKQALQSMANALVAQVNALAIEDRDLNYRQQALQADYENLLSRWIYIRKIPPGGQ